MIIQAKEWRKRPRNNVGSIDNDEGMIEGSLLSNIIRLGSPPLQEHNNNADMASEHSEAETSLLGLRLNKDELLKMIQREFSQDIRAKGRYEPAVASLNVPDTQSSVTTLPLKPSKFHAHILRIGTWQWTSTYDGDLVAKFYYANNKLVWEILDAGLKRKIEINWENISALKVTCRDGGPGTLEIMLYQRPRFFTETNQQPGKTTMWLGTKDFTGGQASIHRRHVLQCAAEVLNKHIVKLLSSNYRLYSLSQEDNIVQHDPYFEQGYSESQVPEICNAKDLYHCYGYQRFWGQEFGEKVPMSVGRNIGERNHIGSQNGMSALNPSSVPASGRSLVATGATSGGLQQHRNMFNWCSTSSLQKPTQNPYLEQWWSEHEILESSSAQDQYRRNDYQQFVGPQFRETIPMSIATNIIGRNHNGLLDGMPILTRCSDLGHHSSAVTGGPSGGLEQHRNMLNWSRVSSETLRQAQLNFYRGRTPAFTETTTSGGLQQSCNCNMFNSSSPSLQTTPFKIVSGGSSRIMDDDAANYMVNPRKRPNLISSMGASADSHVRPEDIRKLVKGDIIRSAKRPASSSGVQQNYSVGSSSRSSVGELKLSHYAFNDTTTQSFKQNVSSATMDDATVLEKISHDLLDDIDMEMEPTGAAEDAILMSTINSLSSLLQPQEVDPDAGSRGAGGGSS